MKMLSEILDCLHEPEITGDTSVRISHLTMDSREVTPVSLFTAVRGTKTDGHLFIPAAIKAGAKVIVCEEAPDGLSEKVTIVRVRDSASALGQIASAFYNHPSEELALIGVTGTNGKTTIATLLYETFTALGINCGLISTIRYITGDKDEAASHTTPDAIRLHRMMRQMVNHGCEYCFMEVSSHAVVQKRIAGLHFTGGIFTNLSHDHLDFHPTFHDYLLAKQSFFTGLPKKSFALTTHDDRHGRVMVQNTRARVFTYSTTTVADFHCRVLENTMEGLHMEFGNLRVWLRLTGTFNARNLAAIYATALIMEMKEEDVLRVLSDLEPVEGRFQQYREADGCMAVVDYAHTPDALKNVLETLREVNRDEGQIITVVGAGGNRDPFKRPLMAKIAAELSDRLILTSDNPRSEPPEKILSDMQNGLDKAAKQKTLTITDRKEAIRAAVMMAEPGDIVLIAGKGHEKYQEIEGIRYPFNDMEVVKSCMKLKNK